MRNKRKNRTATLKGPANSRQDGDDEGHGCQAVSQRCHCPHMGASNADGVHTERRKYANEEQGKQGCHGDTTDKLPIEIIPPVAA